MLSVITLLLGFAQQVEVQAPPIVLPPAPPLAVPARPPVITGPQWARRPNAFDMERYFPDAARDMIVNGRATIECVATATGTLTGCTTISETPRGWGFGDATVRSASKLRLRPTMADGASVEGARLRIPVVWSLANSYSVALLCTDRPAATRACTVEDRDADLIRRRGFEALAQAAIAGREPRPEERRPAAAGYFRWVVPINPSIEECPRFDGHAYCDGPPPPKRR